MNRRTFTKTIATASVAIPVMGFSRFPANKMASVRNLKKGVMWGSIAYAKGVMEKFVAAKEAGFDGVEPNSHLNRDEVLKASRETGLPVTSVCGSMHWKYLLSDPDPEVREQGVEALKVSIEDAKVYGTDTVLLVPGRVTESVSYDECWNRSVAEIKKVLPFAEKAGITIAIENVWNNFLLSPLEAARYVDQFKSKRVGYYFDVGNILAYGWPEQWIRILGKRIARVHIKEYSRKIADSQGRSAGFKVNLLEGDVNWPAVMKALDDIGYSGWTTIEQPGGNSPEGLKDLCDRLIKIHNS
ncbi:MAG: sugar phosphate isomerase/epimerase family protein [Bacteroidales bacterium]